jgi:cell division protein FtsL
MLKFANVTLVLLTLATASMLYNLEHTTRGEERAIAKANAQMVDSAEAIKLLKAEWSSLTRPERIQLLAEQHLGMKQLDADQITTATELPMRLEALTQTEKPKGKGTIEDLMKKMQ